MASQAGQPADEIVRAALTRPVHERAAFLADACADDETLRQEVEKLLRYYQDPNSHSGSLLNRPFKKNDLSASRGSLIPSALKASSESGTLNAPTIRVNEADLPEILRAAVPPPVPSDAPSAVPAAADEGGGATGLLDWLTRQMGETVSSPEKAESLPPAPPVQAAERPEKKAAENAKPKGDVFGSPTVRRSDSNKKAFDHGSPFEQLFKRVTLAPQASETLETPSPPGTEILNPEPYQTTISPSSASTNPPPPPPAVAGAVPGGAPFMPTASQVAEGFTTSARTLDGRMLGPYQLLYEIGRGGMGRVYLAEDTRLGRRIALKLLLRSSTRSPERVRRFEQEARAASSLNHPNILTIHEIGELKGVHYLATEYVDGLTLRQVIENRNLTLIKIIDVAIQISSALAAAHDANIVHRDIKPENLMLRLDGYAKVLDFGIAKLIEKNTGVSLEPPSTQPFDTQPGAVIGTADYMSPEQARGQRVDNRTDIFSLGVVVYEMVTGVRPFVGATPTDVVAALLTREPIPITQRLSGAPEALHRILKRALQKEREHRYGSARELAHDLSLLKQDLELAARATAGRSSQPIPPPPASSRIPGSPEMRTAPPSRPMSPPSSPMRPPPMQPTMPPTRPPTMPSPRPPQCAPRPTPPQRAAQANAAPIGVPPVAVLPDHPVHTPTTFSGVFRVPSRQATSAVTAQSRGQIWLWLVILITAAVLAFGVWVKFFRPPADTVLAIMPLVAQHLSGGSATLSPEDEEVMRLSLAEGLHESLWQRLGPLPGLRVIARNSVWNLRKNPSVKEIASALNARYVLNSRLVTRGSTITLSLELLDGETGKTQWSQRYERTLSDLHTLPESLSVGVADALDLPLNDVQNARLARRETVSGEAYTHYLKGRYLWQQRQAEALKSSVDYLRRATELDANFARAHGALAESYALAPLFNVMPPLEAAAAARSAAAKAQILDAQLAEAYRAQGLVAYQYDWNFAAAEKAFQRALEINPNYAVARQELGSLLTSLGKSEEGLRHAEVARALDPVSSASQTNVAAAHYFAGRYQQAVDACLGTINFNPKAAGALKYLGLAYQQMSRMPDALEALQRAAALEPKNFEIKAQLACIEADAGKSTEAQARLQELRAAGVPQYRLATLHAALGDKEQAVAALTQAVAHHEPGVVWLKVDPQMNLLRNDQRFKQLLKDIGLP